MKKTNKTSSTWRNSIGYKSDQNKLNSGTEYVQKFTNYPTTILEYAREEKQVHPTQKHAKNTQEICKSGCKKYFVVLY